MMIFVLLGRGDAIVRGALNVSTHNSEDSDGFTSAEFGELSLDCLAHSEPRHEGEAPIYISADSQKADHQHAKGT
jgi:hypothetical protein